VQRNFSQSSVVGDHLHIPAHTKEYGLASVLELHSVQAKSCEFWQPGMKMDHSVHAKGL